MKKKKKRGKGTQDEYRTLILAPFNEELEPQRRTEVCIELSDLMIRVATHIICHVLVNYRELLQDEHLSVAHAFLQRMTTTHLCNHKLTSEGLVVEYRGEPFELHEEYKTMTLTRSVYEHLAMFYYLFEHPRTVEEREVVWRYWQINSKKNLIGDFGGDTPATAEQQQLISEVEELRSGMLESPAGSLCRRKLDEWTRADSRPSNGSIEFIEDDGHVDVRRVTYSQAWKYLFHDEEMAKFYGHLSMHCHPVYHGLLQYQDQGMQDQGYDGIPLYFSCRFLAHLCRLFLKLVPDGSDIIRQEFNERDKAIFRALAQIS